MKVRYYCPFAKASGYARAAHDYLMALHRAGVELDIVPVLDADTEDLAPEYHELLPFVGKHVGDKEWPEFVIVHTIPTFAHEFIRGDLRPPPHIVRACVTTWETEPLPTWIGDQLSSYFDSVIVPSTFCEDLFSEQVNLDTTQVHMVPHCFNSKIWKKKLQVRSEDQPYRFLWIGAWAERKNPIGVLKAYFHAFTKDDNVELVMLASGFDAARQDIEMMKVCAEVNDLPPVRLITERLSQEEVRKLHYSSDCYVSLHRSEGFGLGIFESVVVGNPVIATDYSGPRDFLNMWLWEPVPHTMTPALVDPGLASQTIEFHGMQVRAISKREPIGITIRQKWAEPDLEAAAGWMQEFYRASPWSNGSEWQDNRLEVLRQNYSYEAIGKRFMDSLEKAKNYKELMGNVK